MIDEKNILQQIQQIKRSLKSENSDYLTGYICALSAVEGMISGEPKISKWIPCSERLPEENLMGRWWRSDMVLVTDRGGFTSWDYTIDGKWSECDVIAWMPFPEPYKGGDQNE